MAEGGDDFRKSKRPPSSKYYAIENDSMVGKSTTDMFNTYPEFKKAKDAHDMCLFYATAYNEIMVKRLLTEQPDFLETNNLSKGLLVADLTNNMCLPYTKYRGVVFRDTLSKIKEKAYLTDQIRRLDNGGDRFHPYL